MREEYGSGRERQKSEFGPGRLGQARSGNDGGAEVAKTRLKESGDGVDVEGFVGRGEVVAGSDGACEEVDGDGPAAREVLEPHRCIAEFWLDATP